MNTKAKILEQIRKLLALAGNNPNENEAAAAAVMAKKMMQKYDIEIREAEGIVEEEIKEKAGSRKVSYQKWEIYLASAFKSFMPVELFVRTNHKGGRPVFVGTATDVDVTIEMYEYVRMAIWRLARVYGRTVPSYQRTTAIRSFCLGATATIRTRLEARGVEEEAAAEEDAQSDEAKYALVCVSKEGQIQNWMAQQYPNMRSSRRGGRRASIDSLAYSQGGIAGKGIGLNTQISNSGHSAQISN